MPSDPSHLLHPLVAAYTPVPIITPPESSSNGYMVLFVHGLPGHGNGGFMRNASEKLVQEGYATCRYSLRRDNSVWEHVKDVRKVLGSPLLASVRQLGAFRHVNFEDHVSDLGDIIENLTTSHQGSSSSFTSQKIIIAAHSYGAAVALAVSSAFDADESPIAGLFLSNPFISKSVRHHVLPGFSGMPDVEELTQYAASYSGPIMLLYGAHDTLVPPENNSILIAESRVNHATVTIPLPLTGQPDHDFTRPQTREAYTANLLTFVNWLNQKK
ncbi:hypothetical protein HYV86_07550 [Candidatus Woesearchaeota archaeon]|nr:hypothetical protein [Candidatus Woesearchaeota archaeon]